MFHCPGCEQAHSVPTRGAQGWYWNGLFDSPSLSPSILVYPHDSSPPFKPQPRCHSFVTDGRIRFMADCEHALKNQTVDLPEWEGIR